MNKRWRFAGAAAIAASLVVTGCTPGNQVPTEGALPDKVVIAPGLGLGHAPFTIMRELELLEKRFPDVEVEWITAAGGAALRDGIIAGQIDVGAGGPGPFLIGWDKGVEWKVLASQVMLDLWLVTLDESIQTLEDIKPEMQISVTSPDSAMAVALRKNSQDVLGNANAFDNQLVSMAHPDAYQALINDNIALAYTSPPYQWDLVEKEGAHRVIGSDQAFGPVSFSAALMATKFWESYPTYAQAIYDALVEAQTYLTDNPSEAAAVLSAADGGSPSAEQYEEWLSRTDFVYDAAPRGFLAQAAFMKEIGLISKAPTSLDEITLPPVTGGD